MTRKKRNSRRIPDEVALVVFPRLPTRDAAQCAELSRHHRRLVGSLEFWALRRRLAPPPPRPCIAYLTTSVLPGPGRLFHEFDLARHGGGGDNNDDDLRRPLIDRQPQASNSRPRYVGACNGVVALAGEGTFHASTTVVLFNPAVAGSEVEVTMNLPYLDRHGYRYRVSGFGYGPSTRRHKVVVAAVETVVDREARTHTYNAKQFLVYTLGRDGADGGERCKTVAWSSPAPAGGANLTTGGSPVYLDGKVYLLADHSRVLAFDVDGDTVAAIDLPGERARKEERHARSELMEMSGRLCVATANGKGSSSIALWLLTAAGQPKWERRCLLSRYAADKLAGAWDCGGVLLLFLQTFDKKPDLILYDTRTKTKGSSAIQPLHVPGVVAEPGPEQGESKHAFCWGYQPTLVPPCSIVGGGGARPLLLQRGGGVAAALNPVLERDVDAGRKRTLGTVCFMDMLLHIMRQLPDKASDVVREFSRGSLPFSLG